MDDERVLPKAVEKPAAKAKSKVSARTITLVAALFLGFIMIYFDKMRLESFWSACNRTSGSVTCKKEW